MAEKACVKRLQKEYRALVKLCYLDSPVSDGVPVSTRSDTDADYVLKGSEGTPFAEISVTFRKLFLEFVEKYEEQQLFEKMEHMVPERSKEENLRPLLDKRCKTMREEQHRVEETQKDVKIRKRQSFPLWVLALLIPIFGGGVIALPLLQL